MWGFCTWGYVSIWIYLGNRWGVGVEGVKVMGVFAENITVDQICGFV